MKSMKVNILLNSIKTIMSIIFPLITYPYISRVLGVTNIGKLNFSSSIISYFLLLASLGITNYAIREGSAVKKDTVARNKLFDEMFTVNFITMIIAYMALIITLVLFNGLKPYFVLIIINSFTLFFNWIGIDWLYNIYEDYLYITIRIIMIYIISLVLMFLFVKNKNDYIIYSLIQVFSTGGFYIFNFLHSKVHYRPSLVKKCNFKNHITSMIVLGVNLFAVTIYVNSDITIIGLLLGDLSVGIYSMPVKIYSIIKQVLLVVVTTVFPRISHYYLTDLKNQYTELLKKISEFLYLLVFPVVIGIVVLSKDIVVLLFGYAYIDSQPILIILSVGIIFSVIGSIYSTLILLVQRQEKIVSVITIISALTNIVLNFILIPVIGVIGAAITTIISESFSFFGFAFFSYKMNKNIFYSTFRKKYIFISLVESVGILVLFCILKNILGSGVPLIISLLSASLILYIIVLLLFREKYLMEILNILIRKLR